MFQVPRLVKVTQADSPYFEIISPHDVGHKVGPGLPTTFKLQFRPEEKKVGLDIKKTTATFKLQYIKFKEKNVGLSNL